jgi:hypothetical protein
LEPLKGTIESADALSSARECFDQVESKWAEIAPDRVAPPADRRAWLRATQKIAQAELRSAALRYLAESADVERGRCKAFAVWLAEERWVGWLGESPATGSAGDDLPPSPPADFDPDPEFMAAVRAAKPGDWIVSWLSGCRWVAADRAIEARTSFAVDRIGRELWPVLKAYGVTVRKAEA